MDEAVRPKRLCRLVAPAVRMDADVRWKVRLCLCGSNLQEKVALQSAEPPTAEPNC
ncbi:hypothetical protein [Aliterella atlantica]|uniref:hypothetical protein n=1 Tax=Aliterella atlantica TaxID=1827278 RepID=UPI0013649A9F|nr:hypothetical protein [Aliterella atlantica]